MGMTATWFSGAQPFKQIINTPSIKRLHVKSGENWFSGFREEAVLRLYNFIHAYSPWVKVRTFYFLFLKLNHGSRSEHFIFCF